jgi:hypothetical protein
MQQVTMIVQVTVLVLLVNMYICVLRQIASQIPARHACQRRCRPMNVGGLASNKGTRICFQVPDDVVQA